MSSSTVRCPTPDKVRFATAETAQQRADVRTHLGSDKVYRPYACACGWIHLTTKQNNPVSVAEVTTTDELLSVSPVAFRFIVACDVKNRLDLGTRNLLRTPEVNKLWGAELKLLWLESLKEHAQARDDNHKRGVLAFQDCIMVRRTEAENLRQRYEEARQVARSTKSLGSLRRHALYNALYALIEKNRDELHDSYVRELRAIWPEGEEPGEWLPLKFLTYLKSAGWDGDRLSGNSTGD